MRLESSEEQVRSSLAVPQPSLVYQLNARDSALPTVDWLGPSPLSADELLAHSGQSQRPRDRAAVFLQQFLAAGPRTSQDIWEAAQKAHLSARTINRAKPLAGISRAGFTSMAGRLATGAFRTRKTPPAS